ncbi:hypothetical protein COO59_10340 [Mixta theicola]|uniref:Tsi6 domain-containing protein n=1 Tax=Mixta theicola TaxID=1458355 RepID=A0A2K1QA28_9GAMM|nr:immunity protein Tsi6 family protein [Mixta theicola]PNS11875.1 hypothetical protein COO59_10340 [Mixta theicola]GLR07805.1 hypothetical protein GCM10007905_05240 [Mixta theicola]
MNNNSAIDYINRALRLAQKRHAHILQVQGGETLEPMYNSIVQQLIYLRKIITGEEKDKSRIHKMTMGIYAAKEFEETDKIFSDRIHSASFIADQIGGGLKVKLPHEIESDYFIEQQKLKDAYPDDFED